MGIFDSFRAKPHEDRDFGTLQYSRGHWRGLILLDGGKRIPLHLPGSRSGPDPGGIATARVAGAWWHSARPQVEWELFEHYSNGKDGGLEAMPEIPAAAGVWAHVVIASVEVKPYREPNEVQVALRTSWDEEHTLGAILRDGVLIGLNGSILEPR